MYHGEANVAEEDLTSFLEVADDLKVRGLHERKTKSENIPKIIMKNNNLSYERKFIFEWNVKNDNYNNLNDIVW